MTTDMVPVGVSNEHGCHRRQSWRKGLQRFVCTFGEVRSRARVNADELTPVLGNNEVVFREFETGESVDAAGYDLDNAPRRKRVPGGFVLRDFRAEKPLFDAVIRQPGRRAQLSDLRRNPGRVALVVTDPNRFLNG